MQDLFQDAYSKLNNAQKQAVDAIDGPVMVVAGPGTGKTQILTLRIANILKQTDTQPENILALTFTEAGAYNMRKRLAQMIGNPAYRVTINTFHGFCNDVIKKYPEDFPRIIGSKSITDVDQVAIIEDIIENNSFELLKPFGDRFLYVRDILSAISDLKREGITPEKFQTLVEQEQEIFKNIPDLVHDKGAHKGKMKGDYQKLERKISKNAELAKIYEHYQEGLTVRKQYDFNDMILEVLHAMEAAPSLLQILQEEHQYVLVDEHQDTNNAQNKILELLMNYHDNPNLFVVGDEKQAIFRFQGASLENFYYFKHLYPSAQLITLTENYRSTKNILDTAEKLLAGKEALRANAPHGNHPIHIGEFETAASERYFVVHDIKQKIENGAPADEVVVLYRNNKDAFPIARDLERVGVAYQIESDQDLFSQSDVQKILIMLRAIAEYGNDEHLAKILHISLFEIDPLDAYKLIRNGYDRKKHDLYDVFTNSELLQEISLTNTGAVERLSQKLIGWVKNSKEVDLQTLFEIVLRDSGLLADILKDGNMHDRLDAVNALFDQIKSLADSKQDATLQDFFKYMDTVREHNLFLKKKNQKTGLGKVRLMTVHKSKGQEFAHVYIVHVTNGVFGGKIERDKLPLIKSIYGMGDDSAQDELSIDKDADERRLFYVAITRAKESVTITHAKTDDTGRELLPSVFLNELREDLIEKIDTQKADEDFKSDRGFIFSNAPEVADTGSLRDREFVAELFDRHGLSPTALNNYLSCPWKYFYQNLVRIPSVQSKHQQYGTAVHGALEDFFRHMKSEGESESYLIAAFEHRISEQKINDRDLPEMLDKGKSALSGWFETYQGGWGLPSQTEIAIRHIEIADGVKITGKLDRMDFVEDSIVNVIDYKTGKPKSRNELMGKTKGSTGDYYRQLVFYKMLLKYYKDGQYAMQSGVLDFIEPDDKGKYHKEIFEIPDDEVSDLEQDVIRVADEVVNLKFWDKKCDDKDCEFCKLRDLMR